MYKKLNAIFILLIISSLLVFLTSCSRKIIQVTEDHRTEIEKKEKKTTSDPLLLAEEKATDAGKAVLEIGRKMVFDEKAIIKGSCWDYINEVLQSFELWNRQTNSV